MEKKAEKKIQALQRQRRLFDAALAVKVSIFAVGILAHTHSYPHTFHRSHTDTHADWDTDTVDIWRLYANLMAKLEEGERASQQPWGQKQKNKPKKEGI